MKHSAITLMVLAVLAMVGCQKTGTKTISINVRVDEAKIAAAGIQSPDSYDVTIQISQQEAQSKPRQKTASPLQQALSPASIL